MKRFSWPFFLWRSKLSCLGVFHNFCWNLGILNSKIGSSRNQTISLLQKCYGSFALLLLFCCYLLCDFPELILWSLCSLLYVVTEVSAQGALWPDNDWTETPLKVWIRKFPKLGCGASCVCWGLLDALAGTLPHWVTHSILLVETLTADTKWETGALTGLSWAAWVWLFIFLGILYSWEYAGISQRPVSMSSIDFPSVTLVSILFADRVTAASGSYDVKWLPLVFFNKCPREKTVYVEEALHQVK